MIYFNINDFDLGVVLILDGNSEHVAHGRRKNMSFWRKKKDL